MVFLSFLFLLDRPTESFPISRWISLSLIDTRKVIVTASRKIAYDHFLETDLRSFPYIYNGRGRAKVQGETGLTWDRFGAKIKSRKLNGGPRDFQNPSGDDRQLSIL